MRYDYHCEKCGTVEVVCSMKEITNPYPCPKCKKPAKRIYEPAMLEFPGGDWGSKKPKVIKDGTGRDWESRRQKEKWI